jgi:hypothetical protein
VPALQPRTLRESNPPLHRHRRDIATDTRAPWVAFPESGGNGGLRQAWAIRRGEGASAACGSLPAADVHSSRFDDGARSPAAGGRQEGGPQQLLETTKNKRSAVPALVTTASVSCPFC